MKTHGFESRMHRFGMSEVTSVAKGVNWNCNENSLLGRVRQIRLAKLQFTSDFLLLMVRWLSGL